MAIESPALKRVGIEFEELEAGPKSRFSPREGWLTFVLLLFLLFSVVWSVEAADWFKALPALTATALLGALTGLAMAKVRTRSLLLHPLGLVLGYLVLIWQTQGLTAGGEPWGKSEDLISRFRVWVTALDSGGISADPLPFVTIVVALVWIMSYFSSWFVFRSLKLWPVLILTALALFLNLLYLPEKFWFFFYLYILASLLLAMRLHFVRKRWQWNHEQVPYFRKVNASFFLATLSLGLVVILVAWLLPRTDFSPRILKKNWALISTPWKSLEPELGRILTFLPARKPYAIHRFGEAFPFRGTSSLGDNIVMRVSSTRPAYWRAETFDIYTHKGWLTGDRATLTEEFQPEGELASYSLTRTVNQYVELGVSSGALIAGGMPLNSTVAFDVEIAPPKTFTIDLNDSSQDGELPQALMPMASALREEAQKGALTFTSQGSLRLLPQDIEIKEMVREGNRVVKIVLSRPTPNPPDVTALRPKRDLKPFQSYQAVSYVSVAPKEALRSAGTAYPSWVTDRYLQLPEDLPDRIRTLSLELTSNLDNPYDKTVAIRDWLREVPLYSTDIPPPPQDADGVDHFLFTSQKGYSSYFASSMTVMLRSIGIPARLAVGFSTGGWDNEDKVYLVRSSNAHAWPEAYFLDYGWISFEPVPVEATFTRGGFLDDEELGEARPFEIEGEIVEPGMDDGSGGPAPEGFDLGLPLWGLILILAVLLSLLLLLAGLVRYWFTRNSSLLDYPSWVYGKMGRLASLGGLGPRPSLTPREYTETLAITTDSVEGHIEHIGEAYVQSRYGPQPLSRNDEEDLARAWRSLRRPLLFWAVKRRLLIWRRPGN